jgi:hypothetical protein
LLGQVSTTEEQDERSLGNLGKEKNSNKKHIFELKVLIYNFD